MFKWISGKIDCLAGVHDWSPEDFNEVMNHMDAGDEASLRCHRCNKQIVTVEKLSNGDLKWIAHVEEAKIYELSDEYKKERGMKQDIDRFRENNK